MSNTRSMTTRPNGTAPLDAGTYKLGAKGGRMAAAWQHVWDRLDRTEYKGALELAQDAAAAYDLKPVSVSEMLCRMRAAGVLEQEMIKAPTTYSRAGKHGVPMPFTAMRPRVHYRIAENVHAAR